MQLKYSYRLYNDNLHEIQFPHKCLVSGCDCQGFQDKGQKWTDTFVGTMKNNYEFLSKHEQTNLILRI